MPFVYTKASIQYPVTLQVGPDTWILEQPFWHIHPVTGEIIFVPPSGLGTLDEIIRNPVWTTDYRSGGAMVDLLIDKEGPYSAAWLKHDFGYASESHPRNVLDYELAYTDLKELGANWFQRQGVWAGVRIGGRAVWSSHDPAKVRMLRQYRQYCLTQFTMPVH